MSDNKPIYITNSGIARETQHLPQNITYLLRRYKTDPHHPCPTPDAYSTTVDGYLTPLWLPAQAEAWRSWLRHRHRL